MLELEHTGKQNNCRSNKQTVAIDLVETLQDALQCAAWCRLAIRLYRYVEIQTELDNTDS